MINGSSNAMIATDKALESLNVLNKQMKPSTTQKKKESIMFKDFVKSINSFDTEVENSKLLHLKEDDANNIGPRST